MLRVIHRALCIYIYIYIYLCGEYNAHIVAHAYVPFVHILCCTYLFLSSSELLRGRQRCPPDAVHGVVG
jgi:hypothetical protein